MCVSGGLGNSSEGCERGTSEQVSIDEAEVDDQVPAECCQQLGMADGDPGREIEPVDVPNETDMPIVLSIKSESMGDSEIPRVHLRCTSWCAGDANRPGNGVNASSCRMDALRSRTDASTGQADASRGQADTLSVLNATEMTMLGHRDSSSTYLVVGDAKRPIYEKDGAGIHADTSTRQTDAPSVETNAIIPENDSRNVSKRQTEAHIRNSPYTPDNRMPKPIGQWRKVRVDNGDVYVPLVAPIEPANRTFAFGEVEGGDEAIAPSVECEGAGNGDGDCDGDGDGTTSGGSIDSNRVNAMLLAVESQHLCWSRRKQNGHLPVSSWPPIRLVERPYRAVKWYRRRGRVKFEAVKVNQMEEVETAYLEPVYIAQPPRNDSKCFQRVVGPCRRCDWIKIESVKVRIERLNDKKTQELEMTHLGQA